MMRTKNGPPSADTERGASQTTKSEPHFSRNESDSQPLQPEHRADLIASGLSDETIEALAFTSVTADDVKLQGVESAYRLPYWMLDGKPRGFERLKLFPPRRTDDGHLQKYAQPAGTRPHLYLPPVIAWETVAKDPAVALYMTEGEKKSAAACQRKFPTAGIGGVWCWCRRLESGESGALPEFDEFAWKDRPVFLVPDSDAWHPVKTWDILAGFYALGQELAGRGAVVQIMELPDSPAGKVGMDDWLILEGDRWREAFEKLPHHDLDDDRFKGLAAWYAGWASKQNGAGTGDAHQPWPRLDDAALHGLAGEIVALIAPHTEADPVAILVSLLSEVGVMVGRDAHLDLDGAYHPLLFWPVIVGQSSKSRKGSAGKRVRTICRLADQTWSRGSYRGTLSSGEGLAYAVRDPEYSMKGGTPTVVDQGVTDKRLFLVQAEFGSVLRVMAREGNSLSGALRDAWDGEDLAPMTKNNRVRATAPHIGVVAHVTREELVRNLNDTEASNGFANRFCWFLVRRSKELAFSSSPTETEVDAVATRLRAVIQRGYAGGKIEMTPKAKEAWAAVYHDLSADRPGMAGALLARSEAQVMRLAALYSILDGENTIEVVHLEAALALWEYAEASAQLIFGNATGDPVADTILQALRAHGELDDTSISRLFQRHVPAWRLNKAKASLQAAGLISPHEVETAGRKRTAWRLWREKGEISERRGP